MTIVVTNRAKYRMLNGTLNASTDIRMLLLVGGSTLPVGAFSADLNSVADLLAVPTTECAVSGYARTALGSETVTEDDANEQALLDCADVAFGALATGETLRGYALYVEAGSDSARDLLVVSDENFTASGVPTNGGTFTATTALGILKAV